MRKKSQPKPSKRLTKRQRTDLILSDEMKNRNWLVWALKSKRGGYPLTVAAADEKTAWIFFWDMLGPTEQEFRKHGFYVELDQQQSGIGMCR